MMVEPDEGGIRTTLGKHYSLLLPGWYMFVPIIQTMTIITVTPQIKNIQSQSVLTQDGINMCLGAAIKYRIKDPVQAILRVQDYDETIQALVLGICSRYISCNIYDDCKDIAGIEDCVRKKIKEAARGWGLDIMAIYITDLGAVRNIRILTDVQNTMVIPEECNE